MSNTPNNRNEFNDDDIGAMFATDNQEPPIGIDSQILEYAKSAQKEPITHGRETFIQRYAPLFSTAAMVAFAITLTPLLMNSPESALDQDIAALEDLASPASEPNAKPISERSATVIGESSVAASPSALKKTAETAGVSADAIDTANSTTSESGTGGGSENENETITAEFEATDSNRKSAARAPQADTQLLQSDSFADERQSAPADEIALSSIETQREAKETISSVSADLMFNAADDTAPGTNIENKTASGTAPTAELTAALSSKSDDKKAETGITAKASKQNLTGPLFRQNAKLWIAEINRLFKENKPNEAKQELKLFREQHPENPNLKLLPKALQEKGDASQ